MEGNDIVNYCQVKEWWDFERSESKDWDLFYAILLSERSRLMVVLRSTSALIGYVRRGAEHSPTSVKRFIWRAKTEALGGGPTGRWIVYTL